ncbi:unnamed protein product [Oppiella nova]|uniref:Uncharacterized protein n=1 Tax=Oppiella nova TaxID=334625 RepID=A0A7R9QVR6_9ACAR|nr:unnamed protein product [Oppiella nova]CAG2177382.1 unnamed protein product [Oppiella nova]
MPSSFGKNYWIHRCVGCLAACAIASSYVLLNRKVCQTPIVSQEDMKWLSTRLTTLADYKHFATHYYDWLQIYHCITFGWCIVVIILAVINIVPSHQDFKVLVICLQILLMASMAMFTMYTAFDAFHKPCKPSTNPEEYKLSVRSPKDMRPVNVYEDDDDPLLHICLIDAGVGFILLCSAFLFFFDSRQHMIEWRN